MAFRGLKLINAVSRRATFIRHSATASISKQAEEQVKNTKEYKTEEKLVYLEDPDSFGTLSRKVKTPAPVLKDEGDIREEQLLENAPLRTQKLTIKQYADLIKQYLKHKRLKEAIDILEVRMLTQDRVKPENYIYNILIGACAEVGYTKKAFKLFNDMKRRALKTTGDTYTCLFNACANSPWPLDGLKNAQHLRALMVEKGIEPNLTNYNAMIKAFGRCGDLTTAFKIVDEMASNKMKIRVHTFNHLLQACISDKNTGLRHAIVVWRKMLRAKEKPNIYSFNLMLKCVRECNLGTKDDVEELVAIIQAQMPIAIQNNNHNILQIETSQTNAQNLQEKVTQSALPVENFPRQHNGNLQTDIQESKDVDIHSTQSNNELSGIENNVSSIQFVKLNKPVQKVEQRTVPNLLSRIVNLQQVLSLQEVRTPQDRFAIVGGHDDFLKEMEVYSVKPDIKTCTQMLHLLEQTREAENNLIETMKSLQVKTDIDFYNMLIKKRCVRADYEGAFEVKKLINKEDEFRKKRYPMNKKLRLKVDIMTYGVLAMACKTKESAEKLLDEMKEEQLKVNIEILGALLRQGTAHSQFGYVMYIMKIVKEENLRVNEIFIKHLESFNDKCTNLVQQDEHGQRKSSEIFVKSYKGFLHSYRQWLKDVNVEEALQPEHPWKQFHETYPETIQRSDVKIEEPKRFYKRNRKFVRYTPRL